MKKELKVYTTKDYSLFTAMKGNRDINPLHLARLKESMSKNVLTTIIIVNDNYEIIDGQHRFTVSKELGLPINYIVCENYGLKEVQILNTNMKSWTIGDYVDGFCDLGKEDYILFRQFMKKYKLTNQVSMYILGGSMVSGSNKVSPSTLFKEGLFKVKNYSESVDIAEKIQSIKPYYDGYKRRSFVYAIIHLLKNKDFNFDEFINKLSLQPKKLQDCINVSQYKEVIESIYNYKRREKVNLRF